MNFLSLQEPWIFQHNSLGQETFKFLHLHSQFVSVYEDKVVILNPKDSVLYVISLNWRNKCYELLQNLKVQQYRNLVENQNYIVFIRKSSLVVIDLASKECQPKYYEDLPFSSSPKKLAILPDQKALIVDDVWYSFSSDNILKLDSNW